MSDKNAWDVFHWPEFQAIAKRLGIIMQENTVSVTISFAVGELVTVEQKFYSEGKGELVASGAAKYFRAVECDGQRVEFGAETLEELEKMIAGPSELVTDITGDSPIVRTEPKPA